MLLAKLFHGHEVSKPERVDQQWEQTKEVSDVHGPGGDADPNFRSAGQVSPSWSGVHGTAESAAIKSLAPVTPLVLVPCPLDSFQIKGLPT